MKRLIRVILCYILFGRCYNSKIKSSASCHFYDIIWNRTKWQKAIRNPLSEYRKALQFYSNLIIRNFASFYDIHITMQKLIYETNTHFIDIGNLWFELLFFSFRQVIWETKYKNLHDFKTKKWQCPKCPQMVKLMKITIKQAVRILYETYQVLKFYMI